MESEQSESDPFTIPQWVVSGDYTYSPVKTLQPKHGGNSASVYIVRRWKWAMPVVEMNPKIPIHQRLQPEGWDRPRCPLRGCFPCLRLWKPSNMSTQSDVTEVSTGSADSTADSEESVNHIDFICKVQYCAANRTPWEVRILESLRNEHPGINRLETWFRPDAAPEVAYTIFEYCELGDLSNLSKNYNQVDKIPPEGFIWHVLLQLSEVMAFIHSGRGSSYTYHEDVLPVLDLAIEPDEESASSLQSEETGTQTSHRDWVPILHRDIKPENVFLQVSPVGRPDAYPNIKLGDFGLAIASDDPGLGPLDKSGTYQWQPPELERSSSKSDVWALGATVYSLCSSGEAPFEEYPPGDWDKSTDEWLLSSEARRPRCLHSHYSSSLQTWIRKILDRNPETRIASKKLAEEIAQIAPGLREANFEPLIENHDLS